MGPDEKTKKPARKSDVDRVRERGPAPTRRGDNPFSFNRNERLSKAKNELRNEEMTQKYGGARATRMAAPKAVVASKARTSGLKQPFTVTPSKASGGTSRPISAAKPGTGPRATTMSTKGTTRKGVDPSTFVKPSPFKPSSGGAKKTGFGRLGQILANNKGNIQRLARERSEKSGR